MNTKDSMKFYSTRADTLTDYLIRKANNHNCFKLYSTLDRILDIRDRRCLYLGTGSNWNDIPDRKSFNSDKYNFVNFGKCFSFSQDENVAMWMLYGGIEKCSGMIDFTKKGMSSILSSESVDIGALRNGKFESYSNIPKSSFKMYLIDVVYYKHVSNGYYIRRSEESVNKISNNVFNGLIGCKKSYPWLYENECRLIVSINKSIVPEESNAVKIDLSQIDLGKSFERIYHGPNYPFKDVKNTLPSKLDNTIDWSLCDGHCRVKR